MASQTTVADDPRVLQPSDNVNASSHHTTDHSIGPDHANNNLTVPQNGAGAGRYSTSNASTAYDAHGQPEHAAYGKKTTVFTTVMLWLSLFMLISLAAIEIGFSGYMVDTIITLTYSRRRYQINNVPNVTPSTYYVSAVPYSFNKEPTHVALSAGATALVLGGLLGIPALVLRRRRNFSTSLYSKILYHAWLVLLLLSTLLSFGALIYVFVARNQTVPFSIVYSRLQLANNAYVPFGFGYWVPDTWFAALLSVRNLDGVARTQVEKYYRMTRGYEYTLIPLFIFGVATTFFAIVDGVIARKRARQAPVVKNVEA